MIPKQSPMRARWLNKMRPLLILLLVLVCAQGTVLILGAQGEIGEVSLSDIVDNPEEFEGELVTVRAEVAEAVSRSVFRLTDDGAELVVLTPGRLRRALEQGEILRVRGAIRQFERTQIEERLGFELDDELVEELEGQPVIIARRVGAVRQRAARRQAEPVRQLGAFGIRNHRADPRAAITVDNVDQMTLAWTIQTDELVSHAPLVANGRVFFADWGGTVFAADAATGEIIWQNKVENPKPWPWHGFAGTGALTPDGLLIEASVEGNAFALDQETGEVVWQSRITDQPHAGNLSTPLVHDGLVYLGLQSVEEALTAVRKNFKPNFQGAVVALDTKTGEKVWERQLVEEPHNGVAVWSSFALDPEMNALFFTTGNNYTGEPTELSDSIIAVDAKTGEILWANQVTQNDVWTPATPIGPDVDFGAGPQLFEATIDGEQRKLVGAGQKNGVYFAFDRETGEIVWSTVVGLAGVGGGIRGEASIGEDRILAWSNNSWDDVGRTLDPNNFPIDVKALDPATGRYLWAQPKAQPAIGWSAGFLANDVYFVGSLDGTIQAYRASDGEILWTTETPEGVSVASALNVAGDTLFLGTGVPKTFGGNVTPNGVLAYTVNPRGTPDIDARAQPNRGEEAEAEATPAPRTRRTPTATPMP